MFIFTNELKKAQKIELLDNEKQIIFSTVKNEKIIKWLLNHGFPESFIEDIQNEEQSITYEETEKFKLIILKYITFDEEEKLLYDDYNVVIIITENKFFVLTEEKEIITEIAKKFEKRYKNQEFEYVTYLIADILVDNTILIIDVIDEALEDLEDNIFHESIEEDELQKDIYYARRTLNRISKVTIQEKDVINKAYNKFPPTIKKKLKYEFIDINEHLKYLINESRTLLDRTGYLLNLHMGILSTRMNKAMQRLAAISLIFLPLTFVVGNYGMNFKYMPELDWKYGYLMVWFINITIAGGIFIWLKKKKWI
ncbi:magnesium transporter CorA family protein [Caminibacter mediatlanticus TB-2]|uniref:Magnesium transporter CorA family protein n=1 Tax=Caminibacter mediatlanticus TB-2 TaxID=391592 RepID=A0AAI9F202_9BACT|nr:magnesium transporter CorA family protein [Caminibacter mediatlanticus]EDM23284.1 putative transmembrane magnesium and cobalt transporter protein [Caminibacter mediatlanticus TB-2]QCT94207.1 magnesium transporter CorA family protein [Caminibacter mediatlanticus TB-2]